MRIDFEEIKKWPLTSSPVRANLQFARSEYKNLQFGNNKQKIKG